MTNIETQNLPRDIMYSDEHCSAKLVLNLSEVNQTLISAVFLFIFVQGKILVIENPRGTDIPGGHRHNNEDVITAAIRETQEESKLVISPDKVASLAIARLLNTDDYLGKEMWFGVAVMEKQEQLDSASNMSIHDFLAQYSQSEFKGLMTWLVDKALEITS